MSSIALHTTKSLCYKLPEFMSTALLEQTKFADIHRSLVEHGTEGMEDTSCAMNASRIAHSLGIQHPFGSSGRSGVRVAAAQFVFDLARLNYAAWCDRYEDGKDEPAPKPTEPDGKLLNLCALLKALHCVRYNCDGGRVANRSLKASLKRLREVIEALTDTIIGDIPEYRDAEWF